MCDWPHLGKDAESIRGDDMQAVSFLIHPLLPLFTMQYRDTPVNSQNIRFTQKKLFSAPIEMQSCDILKSIVIKNAINVTFRINTVLLTTKKTKKG